MEESYWNTDYWHAMDRSRGKEDIININPSQIGISHGIGDPLQGLKSNIFVGASQVELGFMGQGKGFRSQPTGWTPESVSRPEREAIKQLAKINEVQLSTHATPNVAISGIGEQGFSEDQRERALFEVKKAIDFAADTAEGGPVVLHAQEFPRPLFEKYKEQGFLQYPEEEEKAPAQLVDTSSGRVIPLRRDTRVAIPKGGWDTPKRKDDGTVEFEVKSLNDLYKESLKKGEKKVFAEFYTDYLRKDLDLNKGEERRWAIDAKDHEKEANEIQGMIKSIEKQAQQYPKEAKYSAIQLAEQSKLAPSKGSSEYQEFLQNPLDYIKKAEHKLRDRASSLYQISQSYGSKYEEAKDQFERIKPIEDYGIKQSSEAVARAAMYGYNLEKSRNLERPITIVPENWTPEVYGGHPEELKKLVQESRRAMTDQLVKEKHIDKEQAKKIAQEHIKATFDIGHVNMWRKYFQGSDKEFKQWVDTQVQDLLKNNIIGHVHITDNFGYHDEHLTPGEGTAPIKEFLQRLETQDYKGTIVAEPGGQPEGKIFQSMTGAWGLSNYSMYRLDGMSRSWSDIEGSYFGKTEGPRFVVGDFAPSKDWTLWSEVPLE